jgi:alanine dehydrogenase
MNTDEIIILGSHEIQQLLSLDDCIAAVETAFRLHGEGKAPGPGVLSMHTEAGGFHIKAGMLDLGRNYFAAKINGNFPENGRRFELPTIQGLIVLSDAEKGTPLAVMDSRDVTSLRTAAATAVAAKYLARADCQTATLCGCGQQGRAQLRALTRVHQLRTAFAYDIDGTRASKFAAELSRELNMKIMPTENLAGAARQSDICVTCTPSRRPLLGLDDVAPGTFIAAVGADNPTKQEIHPQLMSRSKVVCDVVEQTAFMGDLHHALEAGTMRQEDVHAELGEVVAGKKPGRQSNEEIIIFDSTGMALQDVAAAALLYEKALRENAGTRFRLAA